MQLDLVCLDTSVIVALIRKDERALEKLATNQEKGRVISTTVMNLCELYAGAYGSKEPSKELEKVQGLISRLALLELRVEASRKYGELINHRAIREQPIGDFDLIIASIALSYEEPLATRNVDHFARVPGLSVELW